VKNLTLNSLVSSRRTSHANRVTARGQLGRYIHATLVISSTVFLTVLRRTVCCVSGMRSVASRKTREHFGGLHTLGVSVQEGYPILRFQITDSSGSLRVFCRPLHVRKLATFSGVVRCDGASSIYNITGRTGCLCVAWIQWHGRGPRGR
jgi:hypothetical protein